MVCSKYVLCDDTDEITVSVLLLKRKHDLYQNAKSEMTHFADKWFIMLYINIIFSGLSHIWNMMKFSQTAPCTQCSVYSCAQGGNQQIRAGQDFQSCAFKTVSAVNFLIVLFDNYFTQKLNLSTTAC